MATAFCKLPLWIACLSRGDLQSCVGSRPRCGLTQLVASCACGNVFYFQLYLGKWSYLTSIFIKWVVQPPTTVARHLFFIPKKYQRNLPNRFWCFLSSETMGRSTSIEGVFETPASRTAADVSGFECLSSPCVWMSSNIP